MTWRDLADLVVLAHASAIGGVGLGRALHWVERFATHRTVRPHVMTGAEHVAPVPFIPAPLPNADNFTDALFDGIPMGAPFGWSPTASPGGALPPHEPHVTDGGHDIGPSRHWDGRAAG